jgi:uncharacterized Zn-binding protein involved in type VI secretion
MADFAAFAEGLSVVECTDGTKGTQCAPDPKFNWNAPSVQVSGPKTITKVTIEGNYPVVENDLMAAHPDGDPCVPSPVNHTPFADTYSSKVTFEGKRVARIGDTYNGGTSFNHVITTGSGKVTIG